MWAWRSSGQFYSYTVPGTCTGPLTFDGKQWVSELPPPKLGAGLRRLDPAQC